MKEVARIGGLTVRTLHHYDAIGLLCPRLRSKAGYRLYTEADLLRLQQIVVYRELGVPLDQIRSIMDDPAFEPRAALVEQRERLRERAEQTQGMLRAVDAALRVLDGEEVIDMSELFDGFDPSQYEDEARARWGHTDAYAESARRTKGYSTEDWVRIQRETDELMQRIAALRAAGASPSDPAAMDLAEEHRQQIDRFYYPCRHEIHRGLARMYVEDSRFTANLDRYGEGVAAFLSAAIEANVERGTRPG